MCSPSAPRRTNTANNQQDDLRILLSRDAFDDRFRGGRRFGPGRFGGVGGEMNSVGGSQGSGQNLQEFFDRIRVHGGLEIDT